MSKEIAVEELKPDELIAAIESGESVTLTRDGNAFATVKPANAPITVHPGVRYPFRDIHITPLKKPLDFDPAQLVIEERERERSGKKYGL